eukprot:scaffold8513_cov37-Tisochrysis_lutea.AAC.2
MDSSHIPSAPVALGYPVMEAAMSDTTSVPHEEEKAISEARESYLAGLDMPPGLRAQYEKSAGDFDLRIWVIDNSGSMQTGDGNRIVRKADGGFASCRSSRWEELGDSLEYHAALATYLRAPTQFCVLNSPGGGIPQAMWCGTGAIQDELDMIRRLRESSPTGRTPLCAAIRSATHTIQQRAAALRTNGKRCVLVIASDGAATDGDVSIALKALQDLPVWVVVRLCTDDEDVVSYWNSIDEQLELDLDVLDDLAGEAREVREHAPWLTYSQPLHRLREWGCPDKIFDLLDERKLTMTEMRRMITLVVGSSATNLPDPQLDWTMFESYLAAIIKALPHTFDVHSGRLRSWIDVAKLRRQYRGDGCNIQ